MVSDYKRAPGYFLPNESAVKIDEILRQHLARAVRLSKDLEDVIKPLTPAQKALALDYIQGHPMITGEGTHAKH